MAQEPHLAGRSLRIADTLSFLVLGLVAVIALLTFRHYGLGWDDYTHSEYGDLLLHLYQSGFTDRRALHFVNLYAYGGGFDLVAAILAKILPLGLFETRRLVGALVGLIGLALTWRIARRLGGPLAGLMALVLLATCPLYYGHMFINAKDTPFAAAMALFALALICAFDEYPAPSAATVVLVGIGFGLAFGTRVLGALAVVPTGAALALIVAEEARGGAQRAFSRAGRFLLRLLPALLLAYAAMAVIWPWSVISPLNPLRALFYFSHFFERPWKELYAGQLINVPDMPRSYLPTLFALKIPDLFFLLGVAGLIGTLVACANRAIALTRRAAFLFVAMSCCFPVALAVAERPAFYNGVRHFVFLLPFFAVLGGLAAGRIIARLQQTSPVLTAVAAALMAVGLIQPVIAMARLHPYEYTYFNALSGGVAAAEHRYMLDYWGLAMKQAAHGLRTKLAAEGALPRAGHPLPIAVCGPQSGVQVELGKNFVTQAEPQGADYVISLGAFYCAHLDAPIIVKVVRAGVVYARVYDIRGRAITSLLTLPPP
jgi:4-amino-4-deoxy-L-arabinose transferase-like glycosyltransferase